MNTKFGAIGEAKIIKAGCGTRYDPEQLGEDSGFDFDAAEQLKSELSEDQDSSVTEGYVEEPITSSVRRMPKE